MDNKDITAVITSFKSETKILNCIKSLGKDFKIIIIENSNDKKLKEKLEKEYPNIKCVLSDKNLGYAKGNNLGLSKVKSEYALILNPDARVEKNTFNNFFSSIEKIDDFSIIGPAKQNELSKIDNNKDKEDIFQVDKLKGFAMFLNLEQFKDIGFFDENFFIYLEEIDLCKRIKKNNKKIFLDKNIKIHHIGGSSHNETINFEMELSRNWHWMWSTFYFNKKHYGYLNALIKISGKFFSSIIKILFYFVTLNSKKRKIYFQRFSGIINSILGKKSWYRPKILIN